LVEAAPVMGIDVLTEFAFSTENWARPRAEVAVLMASILDGVDTHLSGLDSVRIRFIGRRDRCSPELHAMFTRIEEDTESRSGLNLWIAFDYGGRNELVHAARTLIEQGVASDRIDARAISSALYAPGMPNPDLVIRTSGERRLSNFLLWQAAHAELHFSDTLWPDYTPSELRATIAAMRMRRAHDLPDVPQTTGSSQSEGARESRSTSPTTARMIRVDHQIGGYARRPASSDQEVGGAARPQEGTR
jgi:undecaprenyl diphosphate synthase